MLAAAAATDPRFRLELLWGAVHDGNAAALQRHYGQTMPAGVHATIRREIAMLMARLACTEGPIKEPRWYRKEADKDLVLNKGADLAYIDPAVEYVSLASGARPEVRLSASCPCPSCGFEDISDASELVCDECGDGHKCCACGGRVRDEECRHDDGGDRYCAECWEELYTDCARCGCDLCREDAESGPDDETYCGRCFGRAFARCKSCEETFNRRDIDSDGRCDECTRPECVDCDEHADDVTADGVCDDCVADRDRFAPLLSRLINSPRWRRSFPGGRAALYASWGAAEGMQCGWAYFTVLANHNEEMESCNA